jgi:DNA-binding NarL/FixJ family response regulator
VVLLDMSTVQCVEIARALRTVAPATAIVAFSLDLSDDDQLMCVEAGITGFVSRHGGVRELVDAIQCVARGDAVCAPQGVAAAFRRLVELSENRATAADDVAQPLSGRELEIMELIDGGLSNKEIARRLSIGVATVKNHVHHILEKLNVSRRGEASARLRQVSARLPSLALSRIGRSELTTLPDSRTIAKATHGGS